MKLIHFASLFPLLGVTHAAVLFEDSFDREAPLSAGRNIQETLDGIGNNTDTDFEPGGDPGGAPVYRHGWIDPNSAFPGFGEPDGNVANGAGARIFGNTLELALGAGTSSAIVNHNFTNAAILEKGGFSVSLDIHAGGSGNGDGGGFAVGLPSAAEGTARTAWHTDTHPMTGGFGVSISAANTVSSGVVSDFWIVLRANGSLAWGGGAGTTGIFGVSAGQGIPANPSGTVTVNFALDSFETGSAVDYQVFYNGELRGTGSFTWSEDNANHIGLDARGTGVTFDNLRIAAGSDTGPTGPGEEPEIAGPVITSAAIDGDHFHIRFTGEPDTAYEVRGSTDLVAFGIDHGTAATDADGQGEAMVALVAGQSHAFYRIEDPRPNIVLIFADDMGYGEIKALHPAGKIDTPHFDRIAAEGMVFTDAHSSSSVCTPSRYSLLTGRYSWRTRLQSGVMGGMGQPLISPGRLTLPALLRQRGYHTACIGKWHLGMNMPGDTYMTGPILNGPVTRGFHEFFGISASLDMPPYAFIRNDRFTAPLDTQKELYPDRVGPAAADFEAVDVLPAFTAEALDYIGRRAGDSRPFFLYLPLTSPHTPIAPAAEWQGLSDLGPYGDFVMQTDAAVGAVLDALDTAGIADRTLVIFTSDNGFAPAAGTAALESQGHFPSGPFRGYKADIWEGGHRVPFLVRWPGRVAPGTTSDAIVALNDIMATCAEIAGANLPANAGEDSISFLSVLKGGESARQSIIHHSIDGRFAIREGNWKLALCPGSGGWGAPRDHAAAQQGLPPIQLYDLANDIGETANLQAEHPALVSHLVNLLEEKVANGRSTPGPPQANDADIDIYKTGDDS